MFLGALVLLCFLALNSRLVCAVSTDHSSAYVDGAVYWSRTLDAELSQQNLFSLKIGQDFASKVRNEEVVSLQNGCGRPKNLLAVLSDGTKVCCRYREKQWKELRGDLYAYHLNGYLNMWNVPPTLLVEVNFSSKQWKRVAMKAKEAGWQDRTKVALSLFVEDLNDEFIPIIMRNQDKNVSLTRERLSEMSLNDEKVFRLMQWTDMILFDFIIGHTDRLFNTLFNLQWNHAMLKKSVHNLEKTQSGKLVLIDNESGFWMGYSMGRSDQMKYELQVRFLKKMCIFRQSTVDKIRSLANMSQGSQPGDVQLEQFIKGSDMESYEMLEASLDSFQRKEFRSRLSVVVEQLQECSH